MTRQRALRRVQSVFERIVDDLRRALASGWSRRQEHGLHAGRSAALDLDGATVGVIGELSFETASSFEIRGRVAVGELRIDAIAPSPPRPLRYAPPPRFPAIVQDLAVTVPADRLGGRRDASDPRCGAAAARERRAVRRVPRGQPRIAAGRDGRSGSRSEPPTER